MIREQAQFDTRIKRLSRKHSAMSRGYTVNLRADGLIESKPRRARPGVSLKSVLVFFAAFIAFKGFMIASVGFDTYDERLSRLQDGTQVEKAGAWVMQIDPLSGRIAETIRPYLT